MKYKHISVLVALLLVSGCASMQQPPPTCDGNFKPINEASPTQAIQLDINQRDITDEPS